MSQSDAPMVVYVPENPTRGGRKKRFIKVSIQTGGLSELANAKGLPAPREPAGFPLLMKLSTLPNLLGISRAAVYRLPKQGLKTVTLTNNGDKHVRREDLEDFLRVSGDQAAIVRRKRVQQ